MDEIDLAKAKDIKDIVDLNKQLHRNLPNFKWDKREWIEEEVSRGNYFVLRREDHILGAMNLQTLEDELYIETIAVSPNTHNMGIGRQLVDFAKNKTKEEGLSKLTVESLHSYNLLDFYRKVGFNLVDDKHNYEGAPFYSFEMKV